MTFGAHRGTSRGAGWSLHLDGQIPQVRRASVVGLDAEIRLSAFDGNNSVTTLGLQVQSVVASFFFPQG